MQFIIVGGKGGVGRTTVSAALATVLARHGRRVLLAHVRTRQRVERLLGCAKIDEEIRPVERNLWAVNMNPAAALRERGMMVLKLESVYRAVMENRLVSHFLKAVPSLDEYSMLGKAWYHTTERDGDRPRFDTVILDGPATGHLITMLRIPLVILDTVPDGPLTKDAIDIVNMLSDPDRTAMWIVTLAEEMPAAEAADLFHEARHDLGITPSRLVVNCLYPPDFEDPSSSALLDRASAADQQTGLAPLTAAARTVRARRLINRRFLDLLEHKIPLPRVELPHLFCQELDRAALDRLAAIIEQELYGDQGSGSEDR